MVYLVRHGETTYTQENLICGSLNPPLSERGLQSAARAGELLADVRFDCARVSPLLRTCMTAEAIREKNAKGFALETDDALREVAFGIFEGKSFARLREQLPGCAEDDFANWQTYTFPQGDSVPAFFAAAGETLARYLALPGNVLLVTHAGFIGAALAHALQRGLGQMFAIPVRPGEVFEVHREGAAVQVHSMTAEALESLK